MNLLKNWKSGGVHVPKHKDGTKDLATVEASGPAQLIFPMAMHIGAPASIEVKVGDPVKIGTLLGSMEEGISTNVHSSVSGKVIAIENRRVFRGESQCVVVENDFRDDEEKLPERPGEWTPETFSEILGRAGVTGKGGAGFPTAIKYRKDHKEVQYLVVNGSECEPYSTTDYRCMMEYSDQIVAMVDTIAEIYQTEETYIAVEDHMTDPISALRSAIARQGSALKIHILPSSYPQGHAGLQIREVLGIEIEDGQRTGDIGVLQSNVSTIKAMYDAVFEHRSLTRRIVTVTGPMLNQPQNLMVRIGTPVQHLIEACGGLRAGDRDMINGGPMMGQLFEDPCIPVDKDTTTLLFLERCLPRAESDCIRCARCIENCPVSLQPIRISNAYRDQDYARARVLKSESCISCGTCTFVCPAGIPLLETIQAMNKQWKEIKNG